ncbi:protein mono-ADP-ribosyltransferase PARP14-like [Pimephales promelas]|uniref:protein mono-ADP-ribosyltransferase PARP14-like n=1 Tax=Pimephales promelas TaxID=90988 RepID=UPI00195595EA|nr:protein mono-ADP-ribosyltransferase PARP14-like [Pimephales promelas]KAG1959203.1 poly [ADP-ribose] polymerase 14-like [Pimephales promelas]
MENDQHDVFFEANNLSDVDVRQIRTYFSLKRKSGGGQCEISKVGDNTYKISFMNKKAQERVLGRENHVLNISGREELHVSLRCDNVTESSKQSKASANQKCASDKSMEKVFKLDLYLLRYLSESKKPNANLDKLLSALHSTFEIRIESEELVVRRDPAAEDLTLKKWEFGVDQAIDNLKSRYITYFEVDREKSEILEQHLCLSGEDLKIYYEEETCFAVVVGEQKQVEKILKFVSSLHDQQQIQEECPMSEKQFSLIKEQFESFIKPNWPALQIAQEKTGILLLKGPEKEVHAGKKELLNLAKEIREKKIPSHRPLVTFLESSGGIQHFQTRFQERLCSPVMLETSGSDLLLLSLSDGALEEAAVAVQRDLCSETVRLENTQKSPAFNKLKEDLSEAVKQANRESVKVELKYLDESSVDPKVQLVGYTTEVNRLKNIVLEYKRNHQKHHDSLPLPKPEMVDHFPEILSMAGVKKGSVDIKPTRLPSPCIHLTGPRCEVESLKDSLESFLSCLVTKRFEMKGPGVKTFFKSDGMKTLNLVKTSYMVSILAIDDGRKSGNVYQSFPAAASAQYSLELDNEIHIKVVVGSLEQQQADVFVAPMINTNMTSTLIGSSLLKKAGQQLQTNFNKAKGKRTLAYGDVLEVDATPALGCSKVYFIECEPKGNHNSEKALRCGLGRVFELCEQNTWGSVALPIIGPGLVLSIPVKDAVNILTHEICEFLSQFPSCLQTICIAIMPNYAHSEEMFQTVCADLSAKMVDNAGQALFQSLTSDLDEIIMPVDRTELHLVFGDITNETTDAIVNTTDFKDFETSGVCKDILTKAGPHVLGQLTGAQVTTGQIFTTPPGGFPCKTIMHVCGQRDASVIKTLAKEIVVQCERGRYQSVAIPAICAGQGGLDAKVVAKSILEGVKDGVQGANLQYIRTIRIILLKINVFLEFKAMAQQIFGGNTQLTAPAPLVPTNVTSRGRSGSTISRRSQSFSSLHSLDLNSLVSTLPVTENTAAFLVIGHTEDDVSDACRELQRAYESQCSTHSFHPEEIERLTQHEMNQLLSKVDSLHLKLEQSGSGGWEVKGLKDGVNEVVRLIQDALRRQVREKEQASLFTQVTWCILGRQGVWQKVPAEENYKLERGDVKDGIIDAQGVKWTVDLSKFEATAGDTGLVTSLKRLENFSDFPLPIEWDNMSLSDLLKVIDLDQRSKEYQTVKANFKKTVRKTVLKIERIQNMNLRRLYEGRKKELENRNGGIVGAGEKILYHGTSEQSSSVIMKTNFNRNFAGQNATVYGNGTYFAVNASYSANPTYAVPAADGTQLMFVARVLTGHYAQGQTGMKTPPVRVAPDHNYDSVVDNVQNPSMFVVFHDCQAYPEYLIKFI